MIGDERITSRSPLAPINTGQVRTLVHPVAAARAHSGGSISETKRPLGIERMVWVPTKDARIASSRGALVSLYGVTFSILILNLVEDLSIRTALTRMTPSIALV